MQVIVRASGGKGLVKRSPREELALRVRILRGRHLADVYGRVVDELGDRDKPWRLIGSSLGGWLAEKIVEADLLLPDYCIPVPLHPRRRRFRGFNQSALLAHTLANTLTPGLDMPVLEDCLLRTRFTKPQIKTKSREERLGNLKGAFAFTDESIPLIQNKMLWLIDDVATTGTTLEECAMVLKKAGAKKVFGIVLAR